MPQKPTSTRFLPTNFAKEPKLIAATQSNKKVSLDELKSMGSLSKNQSCSQHYCIPFFSHCCGEIVHYSRKHCYNCFQMPLLKSVDFTFNIYDFIRNWMMFSIGEPVTVHCLPIDRELSRISHGLLRKIEVPINFEGDDDIPEAGNNMAVLAVHYNIRNEQ